MGAARLGSLISLGLGCCLLASCGDSGGPNSASSTPPPAAAPLPLTASGSFQTITGSVSYTGQFGAGNVTVNSDQVGGRGSTLTFSYDAATGTYSVQNSPTNASFSSADQVTTSDYSTAYSKTSGTATDTLTLYGNARAGNAAAAPVELSYTSFGLWTHSDSASGQTAKTYFVFGQPTTDTPVSGTATYNTTVSAYKLETEPGAIPPTMSPLSGSATFSANFGAGSVSTALTLAADTYNGTAPISAGNQFTGSFTSSATNFNGGGFAGGFFGPAAKEMGYTFWISKFNPDPYAGASPQPQNTSISGVVVGTKK